MRPAIAASFLSLAAFVAACGGGGGGGATPPVSLPTAVASAQPSNVSGSSTVNVSTGQMATFAQITSGYSGTVTVPQVSSGGSAVMTATLQATLPSNISAPQAIARAPRSIGASLSALVYVVLVPSG